MKKELIFFVFSLLLIGFASAVPLPHGFFGNVYYSDGSTLISSGTITAELGSFEESFTISEGKYDLVVESETEGTIEFYISGNVVETYDYESFAITELDIVTDIAVPNDGGNSGGDSGGSSGGTSSSSHPTRTDSKDDEETIGLDLEENEKEKVINVEDSNSKVTGSVIGFVKSGKGIATLTFGILVVVAGIVVLVQKAKLKNTNSSINS